MTNKYVTKIVAASLLGDGSVGIPPDGSINAKYRQPKTVDHMDYVDWLASVLEEITPTNRYTWQPKQYNAKEQVMLQSRCHPFFTRFRERMYPNGHKVVDPHYLTLLDWEFMAIWYQEDGSSVRNKTKSGTYIRPILCTDCFAYGEQHLLRQAIADKLGVDFNVKSYRTNGSQKYRLHLRASDTEKFMEGIEPFVLPSFSYKVCRTVSSRLILDEDIVRPAVGTAEQIVNDTATSIEME